MSRPEHEALTGAETICSSPSGMVPSDILHSFVPCFKGNCGLRALGKPNAVPQSSAPSYLLSEFPPSPSPPAFSLAAVTWQHIFPPQIVSRWMKSPGGPCSYQKLNQLCCPAARRVGEWLKSLFVALIAGEFRGDEMTREAHEARKSGEGQ